MAHGAMKRPSSDERGVSPPPTKRKIVATATNQAVANFFKPASQKEPEDISFQTLNDSLLVARYLSAHAVNRPKPLKVAALDFDDTLITTKSGLKFARSEDDWRWWHPVVPTRLKELDAGGYAIVILSNQKGVSLRKDPKLPMA